MDKTFKDQFDGLFEKYCELLIGTKDANEQEKVQMWALYSHLAKTMPHLVKHWNAEYPEFKLAMKQVSTDVKEMNEQHRENNQQKKND